MNLTTVVILQMFFTHAVNKMAVKFDFHRVYAVLPIIFHSVWYPVILLYEPFALKRLLLGVRGRWEVRLICLSLLHSLTSTSSHLGISSLTGGREEVLVMHTELKSVFAKFCMKNKGRCSCVRVNLWDALGQECLTSGLKCCRVVPFILFTHLSSHLSTAYTLCICVNSIILKKGNLK